jgi:tetratricopeptide (TPR) repeat protein
MVDAEVRLGQWREAEAHVLRATELDPRNVRFWDNAWDVLSAVGRTTDANAALDRALAISPNDDETIANKVDFLIAEGRLDEAAKWLARLPDDSTNPYVLNLRAWHAMFERKFDEAVFWTEQGTKNIKPGEPLSFVNIWALVHQGYCQEWAGHPDQAQSTFERVIQAVAPVPGSVAPSRETRSMLALAYAGLGDKSNALEQARQGVADFNDNAYDKPVAERYLSYVQARFGDVDEAIATVRHLLEVPEGITVSDLRYEPFWDPLRNDPRFEELLKHPPSVRY